MWSVSTTRIHNVYTCDKKKWHHLITLFESAMKDEQTSFHAMITLPRLFSRLHVVFQVNRLQVSQHIGFADKSNQENKNNLTQCSAIIGSREVDAILKLQKQLTIQVFNLLKKWSHSVLFLKNLCSRAWRNITTSNSLWLKQTRICALIVWYPL